MIDNTKEYLICSAIKRIKTRDCHQTYWPGMSDIFDIEIGLSHPEILHRFIGEVQKSPESQGFLTSYGRFVDRKEGERIARECGQVTGNLLGSVLTSEDLWIKDLGKHKKSPGQEETRKPYK